MPIRKKKISDLTLADSLKGLYTIGYKVVDGVKISVKVGLEYIQVAYEDVVKATRDAIAAAKAAFDAATAADTSRESIEANEAEREDNEEARKFSEQERMAAETQRIIAETGRVNAESIRVTEFDQIKSAAYNIKISVVYKRTNSTNIPTPTGGSFANPLPEESDWSKEIPEGLGRLWVSMRTFTSNGNNQDETWSTPAAMTYNMYAEYRTSVLEDNPGNPDDNPENWMNEFVDGYVWVASQLVYNGTKKGWVVVRAAGDTREAVHNAEVATDAANKAAQSAVDGAKNANTAANRSNALSNHRDEIRDGYWWRWNENTGEYENTGKLAKGNIMFASFDIDPASGELSCTTDEEYTGASFALENGNLVVTV